MHLQHTHTPSKSPLIGVILRCWNKRKGVFRKNITASSSSGSRLENLYCVEGSLFNRITYTPHRRPVYRVTRTHPGMEGVIKLVEHTNVNAVCVYWEGRRAWLLRETRELINFKPFVVCAVSEVGSRQGEQKEK